MRQTSLKKLAHSLLCGAVLCAGMLSLSSCLKGDGSFTRSEILVVKNEHTHFVDYKGLKIIPKKSMPTLDGVFYVIDLTYSSNDFQEENSLAAELREQPVCIDAKSLEEPANRELSSTHALRGLSQEVMRPGFFDENTLVGFVSYFTTAEGVTKTENGEAERKKHSFCLSYKAADIKSSDTVLRLTLSHVITGDGEKEVKRDQSAATMKAWNLQPALQAFKAKTGKAPESLELEAVVNFNSGDSIEPGKGAETVRLTLPYKK